ncbi:hypothetical protein ACIBP4_26870 [Micromonospora maritima]|uniref:Homing endonuclease LAGLIDADG domain-containing protein n=1 Tax=Micromonospora maritima TaxID=986711 RepID=A0ABW7ZSU6_9ACTN
MDDASPSRRRLAAGNRRAARWAERREWRQRAEREARHRAAGWVGALTLRKLLLLGAVLYWCEGTKSKPANPRYDLTFTNSDARLVELFVRFVEAAGRTRQELRCYRGCLVVRVPRSRNLYLWMAGVVEGLLGGPAPDPRPPGMDDTR